MEVTVWFLKCLCGLAMHSEALDSEPYVVQPGFTWNNSCYTHTACPRGCALLCCFRWVCVSSLD